MNDVFCCEDILNMTYLALNLSHYVNGVAKKHGEISRLMFAGYNIDAITNGVHAATWAAEPWRGSTIVTFRVGARTIQSSLRAKHSQAGDLAGPCTGKESADSSMSIAKPMLGWIADVFTVGFARRATTYKRADLLFTDIERLEAIAARRAGMQIIYAGKAHPRDEMGKEQIQRIFQARDLLRDKIKIGCIPRTTTAWKLAR